jgi:hypothetical protein
MRLLLLVTMLFGCQSYDVDRVQGPDGDMLLEITCYEGKGSCMKGAARACRGKKYTIVDQDSSSGIVAIGATNNVPNLYSYDEDRLFVRCGE